MELLEWVKALAPVILLAVSALLSVAGYFGKKMIDGVTQDMTAVKTAQTEIEKDFLRLRGELPFLYITREDHIRHITIVEHKIDDLRRESNSAMADIQSDIKTLLRELPKRSTDG